jgi:TrfA protein
MTFNHRYTDEQISQAARPGESKEQVIDRLRAQGAKGSGKAIRREPLQEVIPFWPDAVRAIPNDVARSAIFTVRSWKAERKALRDTPVFSLGNVALTYTGVELRAIDDELVWQQLLHYARNFGPDNWIEFTPTQLCRDLGWSVNATYRAKLRQSILSLASATILVENTQFEKGLSVRFVEKFEFETPDGEKLPRWRVKLGRELAKWFSNHQFTQIELRGYRELDPIARRLCDYVCSHKAPYALKMDTLRSMCGSETKDMSRWRQQVKAALEQLKEHGFVSGWDVKSDLVSIERSLPKMSTNEG